MKKYVMSLLLITLSAGTIMYGDCGECATAKNCCDPCHSNCCTNCCYDCSTCCLGPCDGYPFLAYRSQSRNAAREIVGWQEFLHQYNIDCINGAFYIALEYTQTFRSCHLARYLFGSDLDCCNALLIQGSQIVDRSPKAWLADYFGLAPDFSSRVSLRPRIQNVIIDFNFHLGLDELVQGLFFRVQAPIVWTKWELNMCECIKSAGTVGFLPGYMNDAINLFSSITTPVKLGIPREDLPQSFTEAASGTTTFGDMKECMKFGRITNCRLTKTRLADLRMSLGYNLLLKNDGHFGIFAHVAAPTGNRPDACYLFEPIVGNGKYWEVGGGITASWIFWKSQDYDQRYMDVCLEGTITHLFRRCECRSFDFCCKPNSRYMLLEEMGTNENSIRGGDGGNQVQYTTPAKYQYKKNLIPAINWATFPIDVEIAAQADAAIKIGYTRCNWSFDIGYNIWGRSGEKFCCDCCHDCCDDCCNGCCNARCECTSDKQYAIKGDSFLYGQKYDFSGDLPTPDGNPIALSATQASANIYSGKNYPEQITDLIKPYQNIRVDNPVLAYSGTDPLYGLGTDNSLINPPAPPETINTSIQPLLVSKKMLNLGKSPSALTHKIFAYLGYAWKDKDDDWIPFLGVGGQIEFAQRNRCCDDCCNRNSCSKPHSNRNTTCYGSNSGCGACCNTFCDDNDNRCTDKRAGVYQYGIWFKGGVTFD